MSTLTGFHFKDVDGLSWWEKRKNLSAYDWVFQDKDEPHGSGVCIIFTYESAVNKELSQTQPSNKQDAS